MSDYELYMVWAEIGLALEGITDRFMALLFAFLVASYLIAGKLERSMAAFVVLLYSVMAIRYGLVYFNTTGDIYGIADQIRQRATEPGSALSWLEIGPLQVNMGGVLLLYVLSYIVSLAFFFHMRRRRTSLGEQPV